MEMFTAGLSVPIFALAVAITLFGGFVKGAIGFAMPLIMISAFSAFLPPELALSGLLLPIFVTNLGQALRDGPAALIASMRKYWRFLTIAMLLTAVVAQFISYIPQMAFMLFLGVPVTIYALLQLMGHKLIIKLEHQSRAEWLLGMVAGLYGGIAGLYGPALLVYLMSSNTEKQEMLRVQGMVFLLGAIILLVAHLNSGLLTTSSGAFSAVLVLPAVLGMAMGIRAGRHLDQARFRWWTQALLVVIGLNLIRRALIL